MKPKPILKISKKGSFIISVVLLIVCSVWLLPILFAIIQSMKTKQEYNLTVFWELPEKVNWTENFKYILEYSVIVKSILNSILYATIASFASAVLATLAAYGLTKLSIKRKLFWFLVIYSGTIFPFQIYLIPILTAYQKLSLYNTRFGIVLFYTAICIPFSMFVMRNFFLGISNDIVESAKIDGASKWRVLIDIMIPMSKAPLSVVILTQFTWCYNELMFGLTLIKTSDIMPIMATISTFTSHKPAMLVASAIASLITIVLYLILNKNFDQGIYYQSK